MKAKRTRYYDDRGLLIYHVSLDEVEKLEAEIERLQGEIKQLNDECNKLTDRLENSCGCI